MLIDLSFSVDFINHLLQSFIVHHVVFAFLRVIGSREDAEMCREGVEHRRYGGEAMAATDEIDVFLTQG